MMSNETNQPAHTYEAKQLPSGKWTIDDGSVFWPYPIDFPSGEAASEAADRLNAGTTAFGIYLSTIPRTGKAYTVRANNGCGCCPNENESIGPFLDPKEAFKVGEDRSSYHHGVTVFEHNYEVSGNWLILDGWYAASGVANEESSFRELLFHFDSWAGSRCNPLMFVSDKGK